MSENISQNNNNENKKIERILFVCTGNTCRSPMAEALCREYLPGVEALSAGLGTCAGLPASLGALEAMERRGLNLDHHRSRPLTSYLLADADLILCMSPGHKQTILAGLPEYADKVFTLGEYVGEPADTAISDPFGGTPEVYEDCACQIEGLIKRLAAKLG